MHEFDRTDLEILELLAADARRPWSDIAEHVDLSPPAVADRVERLEAAGVIRGFTVDLDRSQLRGGVAVLIELDPGPDADPDAIRDRLAGAEAVEHVFLTASGAVVCLARIRSGEIREWLATTLEGIPVADREVRLVSAAEWTPTTGGLDFALTCAECGNTVTSEGESTRIGGEVHHFCCPSCRARFAERYERLAEEEPG